MPGSLNSSVKEFIPGQKYTLAKKQVTSISNQRVTRQKCLIIHNNKRFGDLLRDFGHKTPAGYRTFSWTAAHSRGEYLSAAKLGLSSKRPFVFKLVK